MNATDALLDNYIGLYWISPALCIIGILITNLFLQLIVKKNLDAWIRATSVVGLGCAIYISLAISKKLPTNAGLRLFNNLVYINSWTLSIHLILFMVTLLILLIPVGNRQRNKLTEDTNSENHLTEILYLVKSASFNPSTSSMSDTEGAKSVTPSTSSKRNIKGAGTADISIYVFMLTANLLGGYLLVIANHWLVVYLSIGCMTIAASVLIYVNNSIEKSSLASTRYLIYSIVASAVMLFGLSYLYGSTGTLTIHQAIPYNSGSELHTFLYTLWPIGFFLALSGLFMSSGSFPFQFWVPSIYQPTSFSIVAYLSTVPKIAIIAFMLQLHQLVVLSNPSLKSSLESLWAILAILTLLVGHIAALKTSDAKKLLAYGTIAQTGFFLTFLVTDTSTYAHIVYYMSAYSIMNVASWLGLNLFTNLTNSTLIKDYAGLGRQFPVSSSCFLVSMIALIGLPPTIGFTAKFLLFSKLWQQVQIEQSPLLISLFLINVLGTLFALYYYLKIPYILLTKPKQPQVIRLEQRDIQWIQLLLTILLIGLFFYASCYRESPLGL